MKHDKQQRNGNENSRDGSIYSYGSVYINSPNTRTIKMIYLLQILRMLNKKQQKEFVALFSDLDYELDELGYRGSEADLINDMLFNHFGLSVEDNGQLQMLTDCILKPNMLKAAATTVNIL